MPFGWFMNPYLYYGYPQFPYGGLPWYGAGYGYPGYGYSMTKEQEKAMLEDEAKALEQQLEQIRKRLGELSGK